MVEWSGLVVATGLRPRQLDLPGPLSGRHVVRSLDHANALRSALAGARSLVIIGAGFIGCEVAALAASSGILTHVVAPEAVPIEHPLGVLLGSQVQGRLESFGVQFHLGTVPAGYRGEEQVSGVVLAGSTELAADVVIEAVGCYHRDGELVGVVLLGMPGRYMHYRRELEGAAA